MESYIEYYRTGIQCPQQLDLAYRIVRMLNSFFAESNQFYRVEVTLGTDIEVKLTFEDFNDDKGGKKDLAYCINFNNETLANSFINRLKEIAKTKFEKAIRQYGEMLEDKTKKFKAGDEMYSFTNNVLWNSYYDAINLIENVCKIELDVRKES